MLNVKKTLTKILDALKVDYIVEEGTNNSWTYRKWNSGKYEANIKSQFALDSGTAWLGGYYHRTTYTFALPSFSNTWELVSAVKADSILSICVGVVESENGLNFIWWNGISGSISGSQFGYCDITIRGTWGG